MARIERPFMTAHGLGPKLFTMLRSGYGLADFRADAVAGLTVAIVALPLAMALGIASGASPDKGLATAVVAGFIISFLGGSRVQIGGPTGAFVVVVFNVIAAHGYDGLLLATAMAGVMLICAGLAGLGRLVRYIPHAVVTGFTAGIAVIIATSQVQDFLGLRVTGVPADFIPKWVAYVDAAATINGASAAVGIACIAVVLGLKRFAPRAPGYLIAVVAAVAAVRLFDLSVVTIGDRFPDLPSGLPPVALPVMSLAKAREVLPSAFTIAFLAGIEALLSAVVADGMTGFRHRSNQELIGQGVANLASALFGGLPATGAIARTATNVRAGGRTPVAGMLHALFLLVALWFAADAMKWVPLPALAAILLIVAWGMSEHDKFLNLMRLPSDDRAVLLLTFALTVLVDLTVAIAVGVVLASLMFMARMIDAVEIGAEPSAVEQGEDEDQRSGLPPGVEVFRIAGPIFFGVVRDMLDTLRRIGQTPRVIIVRLRLVPFLDTAGAGALRDFVTDCAARGIVVVFSGAKAQPLSLLERVGLGVSAGAVRHAPDFRAAVALAAALVRD